MVVARPPWWTWTWPALAWVILLMAFLLDGQGLVAAIAGFVLLGTVFAAVYHAEVVAHRVGEPYGTLVLALAVTVIETALIVSVMIAAPAETTGLARDTVFAAVMIVCNGIVGLCLLMGGARYHEQGFQVQGASAALAVLAALTSLTLILPNYSTSALGPLYSRPQLVFAGLVSLVLYGAFVFIQTVRHRDYFLPVQADNEEAHAAPPSGRTALLSIGLLVVSLVAIVGLAKSSHSHGGSWNSLPWCTKGRGRDRHRYAGVAARRSGCSEGGLGKSLANQFELGAGIRSRDHWSDDTHRCRGFDNASATAGTRPGWERSGLAGADAASRGDYLGHGPDHGASGHRTFGHIRRILVLCHSAVTYGGPSANKFTTPLEPRIGTAVASRRQFFPFERNFAMIALLHSTSLGARAACAGRGRR